jgi:hypothetical protein
MRSLVLYYFICVLAVTGATSCQKTNENPFTHVRSKNSESSKSSSPAPSPAPAGPPLSCQVSKQNVKEISTQTSFAPTLLNRVVARVVDSTFQDTPGDKTGLELYIEVLATPSKTHAGVLYHGVRGFLKTQNVKPPTAWEAQTAGEGPLPDICLSDVEERDCVKVQLEHYIQPDIEVVVQRLYWLCKLEIEPPEFVQAALLKPDDWFQIAAARAIGERRLVTLRPDLEELLTTASPEVVPPTIGALGRIGDEASIPALMKVSRGANEQILWAVAVALGDINTPLARRYLAEWRDHHHLTDIRDLAKELLEK